MVEKLPAAIAQYLSLCERAAVISPALRLLLWALSTLCFLQGHVCSPVSTVDLPLTLRSSRQTDGVR